MVTGTPARFILQIGWAETVATGAGVPFHNHLRGAGKLLCHLVHHLRNLVAAGFRCGPDVLERRGGLPRPGSGTWGFSLFPE
jgi:hypothetical protein